MTLPVAPAIWPRCIESLLRAWLTLPGIVRGVVPVAIMMLLWWSSSREPDLTPSSQLRVFLHNGMHVVAYACLCGAFLLWFDPSPGIGEVSWRPATLSWLLSVAYGVVDEVHQSFVPGRVCSVVDVLSDAFGAALAVALVGSCLSRSRVCSLALGACLVGGAASVSLATWGPW